MTTTLPLRVYFDTYQHANYYLHRQHNHQWDCIGNNIDTFNILENDEYFLAIVFTDLLINISIITERLDYLLNENREMNKRFFKRDLSCLDNFIQVAKNFNSSKNESYYDCINCFQNMTQLCSANANEDGYSYVLGIPNVGTGNYFVYSCVVQQDDIPQLNNNTIREYNEDCSCATTTSNYDVTKYFIKEQNLYCNVFNFTASTNIWKTFVKLFYIPEFANKVNESFIIFFAFSNNYLLYPNTTVVEMNSNIDSIGDSTGYATEKSSILVGTIVSILGIILIVGVLILIITGVVKKNKQLKKINEHNDSS